eukprot:TRINITY_DN18740_c0_g1::TRINITY_DN18740_c0_g1_i1::g.15263::m.15263 TRINITY_DN18740_c0_g1::TRINITY_DN18740_c0_g1_i1::g.15263  ORF type:complete len:184 (-),score=22.25,sp/Q43199/APT1_WHEAT/48.24/5e-46,Pribosyltran/PF00156.22/1.9e-15,UPRTase/PF14681.1/0.0055 TRINITY_DN18740_c0_g1_i1:243-767(-)
MSDEETILEIQKNLSVFPFKGIDKFYDISGLLRNPTLFAKTIDLLSKRYESMHLNVIAGLDARGFIFGPPIALRLNLPFVMLRKADKLPGELVKIEYDLEYGRDNLCVQKNAIHPGDRVLLIDDLLATGGTLGAATKLIQMIGGVVAESVVIVELAAMNGRAKLNAPVHSLLQL